MKTLPGPKSTFLQKNERIPDSSGEEERRNISLKVAKTFKDKNHSTKTTT